MLKTIKFGLEEIKLQKFDYLIRLFQIIVSFVLICFMLQCFFEFEEAIEKLDYVSNGKEMYALKDKIPDEKYDQILNDGIYEEKLYELVEEIENSLVEKLIVNNDYCVTFDEVSYELFQVTDNFFEKYNLYGRFSEKEIKENFGLVYSSVEDWEKQEIPIVMGSDFRKKYKEGQKIQDDFGGQYRVIGFLEKGASIVLPMRGKELLRLDNAIVSPTCIDKEDSGNMLEYIFSCQFLVDKRADLNEIEEKNRELELLDTYFESYDYQVGAMRNDTYEAMVLFGSFGMIILIFSIIGIVCMLIELIKKRQYEYAINMLCGATIINLFWRVMFQVISFMLLAVCVIIGIWGITESTIILMLIALAITCVMGVFCYHQLNSKSIITKIRREGE